jgi:lactate permease
MDFFVAILPLCLLVVLMVLPKWGRLRPLKSHVALPLIAAFQYLLRMTFFDNDPNDVHAAVLNGFLTTITPLSVIFGAIVFFNSLSETGMLRIASSWTQSVVFGI